MTDRVKIRNEIVLVLSEVSGTPKNAIVDATELEIGLGLNKLARGALAPRMTAIARAHKSSAAAVTRADAEKLATLKAAVDLVAKRAGVQ